MACRRCSDCQGAEHHWMPNPDFGNGEELGPEWDDSEKPDRPDYAFVCKHCPAVGGECQACHGEGMPDDEDDEFDETEFFEDCEACGGSGVIAGLAFTEWRNDR